MLLPNRPRTMHPPILPCVTPAPYLRRRASRSDSKRHRISSSRTVDFVSRCSSHPGAQSFTWALDVADNRTSSIIHELNAHLRNTTTRTYFPTVSFAIYADNAAPWGVWFCVPVRPRTRVTLTSLTGTLEASMIAIDRICRKVVVGSPDVWRCALW
jgi:hypothetical protein